jgi:hypothetical protein
MDDTERQRRSSQPKSAQQEWAATWTRTKGMATYARRINWKKQVGLPLLILLAGAMLFGPLSRSEVALLRSA